MRGFSWKEYFLALKSSSSAEQCRGISRAETNFNFHFLVLWSGEDSHILKQRHKNKREREILNQYRNKLIRRPNREHDCVPLPVLRPTTTIKTLYVWGSNGGIIPSLGAWFENPEKNVFWRSRPTIFVIKWSKSPNLEQAQSVSPPQTWPKPLLLTLSRTPLQCLPIDHFVWG